MLLRYLGLCLAFTLTLASALPLPAQGVLSVINAANSSDDAAASGQVTEPSAREGSVAELVDDAYQVAIETARMPMGTQTIVSAQTEAQKFRDTLTARLESLPDAFNEVLYILRASSPTGELWAFAEVVIYSVLLFVAGWLVERFVFGPLIGRRFVLPLVKEKPIGYSDKLPYLLVRFSFGLLGILITILVAYVLGAILFGRIEDSAIAFTALAVNIAYFGIRFAWLFWRMVLAPFIRQYRIAPFSDRDSKKLFYWLAILATLDMSALMFTSWIAELGLNYNVYAFFSAIVALAMAFGHTGLILANRRAISRAIRRGLDDIAVSFMLRLIATLWAPVLIIFIILSWFDLLFRLVMELPTPMPPIVAAYSVLIAMLVVYAFANFAIERFFSRARAVRASKRAHMARNSQAAEDPPADAGPTEAELEPELDLSPATDAAARTAATPAVHMDMSDADSDGDGDEEGGHQQLPPAGNPDEPMGEYYTTRRHFGVRTFEDLAHRVAGILTLVVGIIVVGLIWGAQRMFMDGAPLERLLDIIAVVFIGYIAYHAFRVWIDGKILEESGPETDEPELGDEGGAASASRLATLLPLFRNTVSVVIIITVLLIGLLELGINVSPLFAGAGVVGLAVGFGAQSLVRDIFSGAFFLFDDAFRKGEYIDIGSVKGTVENISVRSFQLRHHLGPLHTIPFGEIQFLTNYSRDWVIMKLPLRVTYDTDVERVRKLIKKLGISLLDDPVIGHNFIQPLKSQGVIEMQDSAMIIRVKFMTKPGDQWLVRKRVYQEIRELFEREGIKFAHREVTVRLA
ncbi:MAG: mechanosensitive ion channel family protein, partial [Pseudomonadota bacterium]